MFEYEFWGIRKHPARDNMSIDEWMLARSASNSVATIRFYNVPRDSVVSGYGQALDFLKARDDTFDVVRRPTGGSHVQIGPNTLMYSFTAPRDGTFKFHGEMRKYFADNISKALSELGIGSVQADNETSTIKIDGKVVGGHSMLWGIKSALLHGFIVIDPYDVEKVANRVILNSRTIDGEVYSEYAALKNLPALATILNGRNQSSVKEIIANSILEGITGGRYKKMEVDEKILLESSPFLEKRYGKQVWTREREPAFEKNEVEEIPGEELSGPLKETLGYCLYLLIGDKEFKKMAEPE